MSETLTIAVITGLCTAIPSVIATLVINSKNNALQDERIAVINNNISELSNRVDKHNNYGLQLARLETRVEILEKGR